jgi:hypothetical protein
MVFSVALKGESTSIRQDPHDLSSHAHAITMVAPLILVCVTTVTNEDHKINFIIIYSEGTINIKVNFHAFEVMKFAVMILQNILQAEKSCQVSPKIKLRLMRDKTKNTQFRYIL